jgi:hypothetical protein
MTGNSPETAHNPSVFDQRHLNHVGIELCDCGSGERQFAHTALDRASVDEAFDGAKVIARMIVRRLGGSE